MTVRPITALGPSILNRVSACFRALVEENVKSNVEKIAKSRVIQDVRIWSPLLWVQLTNESIIYSTLRILQTPRTLLTTLQKYSSMAGCTMLKLAVCWIWMCLLGHQVTKFRTVHSRRCKYDTSRWNSITRRLYVINQHLIMFEMKEASDEAVYVLECKVTALSTLPILFYIEWASQFR